MFLDPKIKDQIRKYLAQSSNAFNHSELPIIDTNDLSDTQQLLTSSSSNSSLKAPTSSSRSGINPTIINNASTSAYAGGRSHALGHRISSSDPASRPSRIPQAIKSPTHSVSTVNAIKSHSHPQSPQSAKQVLTSQIPTSNGSFNNNGAIKEQQQSKARFEAYMMTGDLILNLSRTPQSSGLLPMQSKKVSI